VLIIVRHGRTEWNARGVLLGRADPDLDDLGRQQAAALAAALPGVTRVVSSPLARTRQTAACFGVPVDVDDRWIELDYGELDGVPLTDVPAELWEAWRSDAAFAPPGGESLEALGVRVRAACEDLREEATRADVVVVSHVSPIKAAVGWALGMGDDIAWKLFVAPASITRVAVDGRVVLRSFNEVAHLEGRGA
jgi:broad specificity phosphatase PhoE